MRAYFTGAAHSDLTRDGQVAAAVIDVLTTGATARLPRQWRSRARAHATVTDAQLLAQRADKLDWARLEPAQRQAFLDQLNAPEPLRLRVD
jgi:hypothetical protein